MTSKTENIETVPIPFSSTVSTNMIAITVRLNQAYLEAIDDLVGKGFYPNRSEFIREAVRKHLIETIEKLVKKVKQQ